MLLLAQSTPKQVTDVVWVHAPEAWQVFLIGALVAAFVATCYLLEPKAERPRLRPLLALLRALVIALAVGVLFRPVQQNELQEEKNGLVVLALDTSRSMGFLDREKDEAQRDATAQALSISTEALRDLNRLERVKLALRLEGGKVLRGLAEKNRVRIYGFDATRKRLADIELLEKGGDEDDPLRNIAVTKALAELDAVAPDGQATALGDSLQRILTDVRSEKVAALVLFSDGRNNAGSLAPEAVAARFGRKNVPVIAVGVGDPDPPRDLSVDDFRAPDVSLAGDVLQGSLLVRAQGYTSPKEVQVKVMLDDLTVYEQTGTVGGDQPEIELSFTTKITNPGEYTLKAEVAHDPDELTADNNQALRRVRVIDERIRVLYIEGYPRWEYRYLKNALIRDKHMQVQCLLLSADPDFVQEVSEGVPPLKRLPPREALLDYHVVILGDVSPEARDRTGAAVFPDGALEAIKDLVKDRGGGLLMLSGDQFAPSKYGSTPIADLLPITIQDTQTVDATRAWRPAVTREGYESPLLRLEPDEAENRELWDVKLPDLYWYAQTERAKPQAHVLLVHPRDKNNQGPYPLAAWQRYGAGTCMWLAFDEAWRWRQGVGDKYHYRFYGQLIRWLSLQSFTRAKRFFVTTDKTSYDVGETVQVRAEIRDREAGAEQPTQEVIVEQPDGSRWNLQLRALEGEPGKFEGSFKPIQTGAYRVRIDPGERGSESEVATRVFEVKLPRLELQEPRMDQEGLTRVAQASDGGKFIRLHELAKTVEQIEPLQERIRVGRTERELWDRPEVFWLFLGLILLEWIGRKVSRLL